MKKIFFFVLLVCSYSLFAQTGVGWQQIRYKPNFLDSANFAKNFKIGGTTVDVNATEFNILNGALPTTAELNRLVGVASPLQTQINLKLNIADSVLQPSGYFSKFKGNAVELDLNTYNTIPAATTTGNVLTADGTDWISAAPTIGGNGNGDNTLLYTYDLFVGDAGAPADGDTSWTQTNFVENRLSVYRAGYRQHRNATGALQTTRNGYRFQRATGEVIFKPALATNEHLLIEVYDSTIAIDTDPPVTSTLVNDIKTYYKLDEVAGDSLDDAVNNKNIYTDALINQTGVIGKAVHLGWKKEISGFPYKAATTLNWSSWTVKLWVKLDSLPSATGRPYTLFSTLHSATPYWNAILRVETDNRLRIRVRNDASAVIESYGDTLQTVNHWYHIVVRFRGNGYATQIFKAGAESTEAGAGIFSGTLYQVNRGEYWGTASDDDGSTWTSGLVDECATAGRAWTEGEILESFTKESAGTSYPY